MFLAKIHTDQLEYLLEFVKTDLEFRFYQRLGSPNFIWANSVRGGYLKNLSRDEDSGVPTDWAYILGGIYTVRGFDLSSPKERIPKDGSGAEDATDSSPAKPGFKLGQANEKLIKDESNYYLLKSEFRFPLYGDFGGVLFYDGGAVRILGYKGYHFQRPYRDAVGFGFRYNTPVGPVAMDFAFKIRPEEGEDPFRFHFSIGTF